MSLNVRGKDHNPRESRGPPSKKAKDTRSNNLIKSNKKSAVEGHPKFVSNSTTISVRIKHTAE